MTRRRDASWAGSNAGGSNAGGGTNPGSGAVIWTSKNGLTWQRMTAGQLGLAAPGETVQNIAYATYQGNATLISGAVSKGSTSYDAAWLSTDGGAKWTRLAIPADHGATDAIKGVAFDGSGLIAVGPGRVGRVVLHHARVEQVGERRECHRRARVPRLRLLHGVHRQRADRVDGQLV